MGVYWQIHPEHDTVHPTGTHHKKFIFFIHVYTNNGTRTDFSLACTDLSITHKHENIISCKVYGKMRLKNSNLFYTCGVRMRIVFNPGTQVNKHE